MSTISFQKEQKPAFDMRFKHILVPTDCSEASRRAFPWAVSIAQSQRSRVSLLHFATEEEYGRGSKCDHIREEHGLHFFNQSEFLSGVGIEHREIFCPLSDTPWRSELGHVIARESSDLVIVGTSGRKGLQRLLHGSVAEAIFRSAPCPVLTIGPNVPDAAKWPAITAIVYATDFSPESIAALPYAQQLACDNLATLWMIHVQTGMPLPVHHEPERRMDRLRKLAHSMNVDKAELAIVHGEVADGVVAFAQENSASLIVLGVKRIAHDDVLQTHGKQTIAGSVVAEAPCPVLTYRGPHQSGSWPLRESPVT